MDFSAFSEHFSKVRDHVPLSHVQVLPVLPLPNIVLIPGTVLPITILDDAYRSVLHSAFDRNTDIVACFSPLGKDNQFMPSSICGAGSVIFSDEFENGNTAFLEGNYRVEILEFVDTDPVMRARVRWLPDHRTLDMVALKEDRFLNLVKQWLFLMGDLSSLSGPMLDLFEHPHELVDCIAGYFLPDYTLKQKFLETVDCRDRVQLMEEILGRGVGWLAKSASIQSPRRIGESIN